MTVYTYIPEKVEVNICGWKLSGVKTVSVSQEPQFKTLKGIRGKNTKVFLNNNNAVVQIDILQTSPTNDVLSELLYADIAQNNVRIDFSLFDTMGTTGVSSNNAFIAGQPETTFNEGVGVRRWTIELLDYTRYNIGGNSLRSANIFDIIKDNIDKLI